MIHFPEQAGQVVCRLCGNVVEVDAMPNAVHDSEKESSEGDNLVEGDVRVKRHEVVDGRLPQVGDHVPGHRDEKHRVGEHHGRGGTTCDCHTIASNTT